VGSSYSNIEEDYQSNVESVRFLLELLRKNDFYNLKFINLSSAAVYGNPLRLPIEEEDRKRPLSPYGFHKLLSEILLQEYSQCFGLKTLSLRIFSAYGIGQKKLLLWDLHKRIETSDDKIILYGTGNESRDFIHIKDIALQILLSIDNATFQGEAVNVANGEEVRVFEVVELFMKYYPKKFDFQFNGEIRLGDPLNWSSNIDIMKSWGYKSTVSFEKSVKDYINWVVNE
jgi:dTDP-glucose 4,6-dehydratase/UDP-glucose 4-epimerase